MYCIYSNEFLLLQGPINIITCIIKVLPWLWRSYSENNCTKVEISEISYILMEFLIESCTENAMSVANCSSTQLYVFQFLILIRQSDVFVIPLVSGLACIASFSLNRENALMISKSYISSTWPTYFIKMLSVYEMYPSTISPQANMEELRRSRVDVPPRPQTNDEIPQKPFGCVTYPTEEELIQRQKAQLHINDQPTVSSNGR